VCKDIYELTLELFEFAKDFPREYKFTLGQDIKRDSIELVRFVYRANSENNQKKTLISFRKYLK